MPWLDNTYMTSEQLEREKQRARAILSKGPAMHGITKYCERDRWALSLQTGRDIKTSADLAQYQADTGTRVMEPGDKASKELENTDYDKQIHEAKAKGKIPFVS